MYSLEEQARERSERLRKKKRSFFIATRIVLPITILTFSFILLNVTTHYNLHKVATNFSQSCVSYFSHIFRISKITIQGREHTNGDSILATLGVSENQSILTFDIQLARERLELLNWVYNAQIQRFFPNRLHIKIQERKAKVIFQKDQQYIVIDQFGHFLQSHQLDNFSSLPIVVGKKANENIDEFLKIISSVEILSSRVRAAQYVSQRRWNIQMDNRLVIKLPEKNPLKAWKKFHILNQKYHLLDQDIVAIDLRQPQRIYLQFSPSKKKKKQFL